MDVGCRGGALQMGLDESQTGLIGFGVGVQWINRVWSWNEEEKRCGDCGKWLREQDGGLGMYHCDELRDVM